MVVAPTTQNEFREAILSIKNDQTYTIRGTSSHRFLPEGHTQFTVLSTLNLSGIIELQSEDMIATLKSGTTLHHLHRELAETGHSLGMLEHFGTLGGWLASGRPHYLEGPTKSLRDRVLGMTVLLSDGTIAKSGSKVVKSVAGYDLHRFMVGSRGKLALILDVTLRLDRHQPIESPLNTSKLEFCNLIHRCLPSDFETLKKANYPNALAADHASTLFANVDPNFESPRFDHDWVMAPWIPIQSPRLTRAKELFDPLGRFA